MNEVIQRVFDFWFGAAGSEQNGQYRDAWFKKDDAFDTAIRGGFLADYEAAANGDYDALADTPLGSLALIILLDQFSRNLFRGSPKTFAADAKALKAAKRALDRGFDADMAEVQKLFLYLPFEHSEVLADQERSVALFKALGNENLIDYAVRHYDIVAKFGRFPHRNTVLGRPSTPEEEVFLTEPGSSF